jgi:hypothetical protein
VEERPTLRQSAKCPVPAFCCGPVGTGSVCSD